MHIVSNSIIYNSRNYSILLNNVRQIGSITDLQQ